MSGYIKIAQEMEIKTQKLKKKKILQKQGEKRSEKTYDGYF